MVPLDDHDGTGAARSEIIFSGFKSRDCISQPEGLASADTIRSSRRTENPKNAPHQTLAAVTWRTGLVMQPGPIQIDSGFEWGEWGVLTWASEPVCALAETIIGFYKAELIRHRGPWHSVAVVEPATAWWVGWFNTRRLYGPLGGIPPAEYEHNWLKGQQP
jgi:transposase InsO family protein